MCALLLLMILPTDLNYASLVTQTTGTEDDTSVLNKVVLLTVLSGSCYFIATRQRLWLAVLRSLNPFYLLFLALTAISLFWSIAPDVTTRHVFRLLVIFLACTAFTLHGWTPGRFQVVMRNLLGALLVGSIVFAIFMPQYGVEKFEDYGAGVSTFRAYGEGVTAIVKPVLRGLTYSKNQIGPLAGLGLIFWLHAWLDKQVKFFWFLVCGGASAVCLYWAHSSTALLASAFSVVMILMLRHWPQWLRRYMPHLILLFSAVVFLYSLVILRVIPGLDILLSPITAMTGKDLTFSSRTSIWEIIAEHIAKHPWIGTGYSAYWTIAPGSPALQVKTLLNFFPGESHNGYLDVQNDLGAIGSLCLLGYMITSLRQSVRLMAIDRSQGSIYLVLLFYVFWSSMSESHWFSAESVLFTVLTLSVCCCARGLLQHEFSAEVVHPLARHARSY
jgi:O-antigen ligase